MRGESPLRLHIRIAVSRLSTGERLEVSEELDLGEMDFLEICKVLSTFHELAEKLKRDV